MRAALRLAGAGALCSTAGVGAYAQHDEGTARSMTFWYHAFPVWAQYRAVQWRNRDPFCPRTVDMLPSLLSHRT